MQKILFTGHLLVAAMINEIVRSFDDYFSAELNQVKLHYGQNRIAELERKILHDSKLIRKREDHFFNGKHKEEYVIADKVQEYYSIRCVPQILGPILDTLEYAEKVLLNEANSASDNPVIDSEHGQYFSWRKFPWRLYFTGNGQAENCHYQIVHAA